MKDASTWAGEAQRHRNGRRVWGVTLALVLLSCGLAWGRVLLLPPVPSPPAATKQPKPKPKPRAPGFKILDAWARHLTPAPPTPSVHMQVRGKVLLEVLWRDKKPMWTLVPKLWDAAKPSAVAQDPSPSHAAQGPALLHWPIPGAGQVEQQKLTLDLPQAELELLAPQQEGCRIRWWLHGEPRAQSAGCDLDGDFELQIEGEQGSKGWIEIGYPGRLTAQLPLHLHAGRVDLGSVALGYGFQASISVQDSQGQPLPGVRASLRHYGMPKDAPALLAQSDQKGRVNWDSLPAGGAKVEIHHPGFRTQSLTVASPSDAPVPVVMEPVQRLWGQVYLPKSALQNSHWEQLSEGQRYKKVQVRLAGSGIWPPRTMFCREDGSFQFSEIPAGVYAVEAFVDDDELQLASFPLENVPSDHAVSLNLQPAQTLVLGLEDERGDPVRGAKVTARSNALGLLARSCESDEVGFCRLAALVPTAYQIDAHAPGYLSKRESVDRSFELDGPQEEVVMWTMQRAPSCSLRLVNPQGEGLAMAQVWVEHDDARANRRQKRQAGAVAVGVSDEEGFVSFEPLAKGRYRIGARLAGFTPKKALRFRPGAGCLAMNMVMQPATRVRGVIHDDRGLEVANALVQLRNRRNEVLASTRSDEQGSFELEDAVGRVQLVVKSTGYRPYSQKLHLQPKKARELDVEVSLHVVQTGQLELELVNGHGEARPQLQVELIDPKGLADKIYASSDRHGVVELDRLPFGRWMVRVWCDGQLCLERNLDWKVNEQLVHKRWVLKDPWDLVVTVTDDVADPVAGAGVKLPQDRARTNEQGQVQFQSLWKDKLKLRVRAEDFVTREMTVQRPTEDRVQQLHVEMARAGSVEGEVLDAWGEPVADATLVLSWHGGEIMGKSGPAGHFLLHGLPEGDWQLQVRPPPSRHDLPGRSVPLNIRAQLTTRDVFVTLGEL